MPFIAICFVAQNHCVMVQLIVPTCVYALLAYISPSQNSWLRIRRATLMLLGNFSSFWTRYCVLLLYDVDYFGTKSNFICFSRYFLLFIFFQPCPARVAVPCPSAFAPGKFVLVHHVSGYSVIGNSGTADQLALWGSPPWLPSTSMTWCISWLGYLIVHVIHVPFSFIKHLFSGCFPLRERPLYAISDGEIDPVEVGAPVFGTLADYAEFRRMRHNKTLHR